MENEQLWEKKKQQIMNMPLIESSVFKSKDGSYVVHKTTITDIKSTKYYDAVMKGKIKEE